MSTSNNWKQISEKPLDIDDDLADVLEIIEPAASKWKEVGIRLRIPLAKLEEISTNNGEESKQCLIDTLAEWLRRNFNTDKHGEPTPRQLAEAIDQVDRSLVRHIAAKYRAEPPIKQAVTPPTVTVPPTEAGPHTADDEPEQESHPVLLERPTPKLLQHIKYKDPRGRTQSIRPEEIVATKWREMGTSLCFDKHKLDIWDTQFRNDKERAHKVLGHWLANGSSEYSLNWNGFLELCQDIQLSIEAKDIRTALIAWYESKPG